MCEMTPPYASDADPLYQATLESAQREEQARLRQLRLVARDAARRYWELNKLNFPHRQRTHLLDFAYCDGFVAGAEWADARSRA